MNYVIAVASVYGSILLGTAGRDTRLGRIGASITDIIIGIFGFILISREITRNKEKKQRMTKRINAVITNRERKKVAHSQYRYIYIYRDGRIRGSNLLRPVTFADEGACEW